MELKKMSWDNISIKQYLQISDTMNSALDDSEKMIAIANIVYDCDVTELPLIEYNEKIRSLSFINDAPDKARLNGSYVVNGTKYKSNANLESIQANQFIDFQNYAKAEDIIGCISCFFIPEGHKYNDGYDMLKVKNDIEKLPIVVGNALAFFFKSQYAILLVLSQRYSLELMKQMGMSKEKLNEMQDSLARLGIANLAAILSY